MPEEDWITFGRSPIHGAGAFARIELPANLGILEYVGEKIGKEESWRRRQEGNEGVFYLDEEQDLDGNVEWNPARVINHSCSPNCRAELIEGKIWIISLQPIPAGSELTFNYGYDLDDYDEHPCHCGSPNCVGYMVAEEFFQDLPHRKGY